MSKHGKKQVFQLECTFAEILSRKYLPWIWREFYRSRSIRRQMLWWNIRRMLTYS